MIVNGKVENYKVYYGYIVIKNTAGKNKNRKIKAVYAEMVDLWVDFFS